jgi:N-dimethylarginine dimethylaminohydrolase
VDVRYAINPWMDPEAPFDPERAQAQWRELRRTLVGLGHHVAVLPAQPGLPDLVFAANGALVLGERALVSRFAHPERSPEADLHRQWLRQRGLTTVQASAPCEGEGDLLVVGRRVLVGHGVRSTAAAADDVARLTDRDVVTLELADPRYYHLDTALGVLDDHTVAWHPPAFTPTAAATLRALYPHAIEVDAHDAALLGCNLVSDGRHVVVPAGVSRLAHDLSRSGFEVVAVDLSELRLAGGGPKCCVAEHHPS